MNLCLESLNLVNTIVLAESVEEIIFPIHRFYPYEMEFLKQYREINANNRMKCFQSFKLPCFRRRRCHDMFYFTWIVTRITATDLYVKCRIYLSWPDMCLQERQYYLSQCLFKVFNVLRDHNLPDIVMKVDGRHRFVQSLQQVMSEPLDLPLPFHLSYVFNETFKIRGLDWNIYPQNNFLLYKSLAVNVHADNFIRLHDQVPLYRFLCYPMTDKTRCLCPYKTSLRTIRLNQAVQGGGLFIGDCGVGKTTKMMQYLFSDSSSGGRNGGDQKTLFVASVKDRPLIDQLCQQQQQQITCVWSVTDIPSANNNNNNNQIYVLNDELIRRSKTVKSWLKRQGWSRIVLDNFDQLYVYPKLLLFCHQLQVPIVWLLSNSHQVQKHDFLKRVVYMFGLQQTFPEYVFSDNLNLFNGAIFHNLSYRMTNIAPIRNTNKETVYMVLPRLTNVYPDRQIRQALKFNAEKVKYPVGECNALLSLLCMIDSGMRLNKKQMMKKLMTLSNMERPGGGVYWYLPPYNDLQVCKVGHEFPPSQRFCIICQDQLRCAVKNKVCRHVFCYSCLDSWNLIKSECPHCKQTFEATFFRVEFQKVSARKRRRTKQQEFVVNTEASMMIMNQTCDEQYVDEKELFYDYTRQECLKIVLRKSQYDQILLITHFDEMLDVYEEVVHTVMPKVKLHVARTLDDLSRVNNNNNNNNSSRVMLITSNLMTYFKHDSSIEQVVLLDNNHDPTSFLLWYNYFRQTTSRVLMVKNKSIGHMWMNKIKEQESVNLQHRLSDNVYIEKKNALKVLNSFYKYIT